MTDQQIAKWIDQLQGELDALKRIASNGSLELSKLGDVSISNPADADIISYDDLNDKWVNMEPTTHMLQDVQITSPQDGQLIVYNELAEKWQNGKLSPNLILDTDDILTTDATEYSCNWSDYEFILIECGNYYNISGSSLVPASYLVNTDAGTRVVIYMGTYYTFEVWKSGNNAVYVRIGGTDAATSHLRVRIYGIMSASTTTRKKGGKNNGRHKTDLQHP